MKTIVAVEDLAHAAAEWHREGAVIVLAAGCWDPFHAGHAQHLKAARELGNVFVVSVTADEFVDKGPNRPHSPDVHRAEVIADLRYVDAVVINRHQNAVEIIRALRPHIFVKGVEYWHKRTPQILAETEEMEACGGRVEYVTGQVVCSSTEILSGVSYARR